ncbi:MAG: Ig-like domain-containing protein [Thermoplasmatales archaeon]|nr:Ig-like domain-containing protein [Thermoplasmatales archaeon]
MRKIMVVWLSIIILTLIDGNVLGDEDTTNDGNYHVEYSGTIEGSSPSITFSMASDTKTFPVNVYAKNAVITVSSDKDMDLYVYNPDGDLVAKSVTANIIETVELNSSELSLTGEWDAMIHHYSAIANPYNSAEYHLVIDVYYQIPNQKPTVTIISPSENDSVANTITITGTANDTDGIVQKVEIKIDAGSWVNATGTTSWSYKWDTTTVSNGEHTIYARSFDGANYSTMQSVTVNVGNEKEDGGVAFIPAFELISLISAFCLALAFKRRKKI